MLQKTNLIDTHFQIKSHDHHKSRTDKHIQNLTETTSGVRPNWQAINSHESHHKRKPQNILKTGTTYPQVNTYMIATLPDYNFPHNAS